MKAVAVVVIAAVVAVAVAETLADPVALPAGPAPTATYPPTWDNIDLDKILTNDRLVNAYVNCFLDKGACSPEGETLKRAFPEVVMTQCAKCSEKQKQLGMKVVKFMMEKKPQEWQQIVNKYDPSGEFVKKIKAKL